LLWLAGLRALLWLWLWLWELQLVLVALRAFAPSRWSVVGCVLAC
jgi:hypothetical protein